MSKYSKNFYLELSGTSDTSANVLVPILFDRFSPSSIIDFGCGTGSFCKAFMASGVSEVVGIEGEWILHIEPVSSQEWLSIYNLKFPISLNRRFDLAICLEVAEHLPSEYSRTLIGSLVEASDRIAFSAAIPGQSGTDHINLQYPEYWAELFAEHQYFLELDPRNEIWKAKGISPWYKQNLLIFHKKSSTVSCFTIPEKRFHPEIFPEYGSLYYRLNLLTKRILKRFLRFFLARS